MLDLQKASTAKRISAFLFDIIVLSCLVVGLGFALSAALGYDGYVETLDAAYERYAEEYHIELGISAEKYDALSPEGQQAYLDAQEALSKDREVMHTYSMVVSLSLLIMSLSIFLAYLIAEFAIPLWLGNGQTLGKKIFSIGVMHTSGVQVTPMLMFLRTILGKYTIETMVPALILMMIFFGIMGIVGTAILAILLVVQIVLIIATRTNSLLHDVIAGTVVIDMASQKIFKNAGERLEYLKRVSAEEAAKQSWF